MGLKSKATAAPKPFGGIVNKGSKAVKPEAVKYAVLGRFHKKFVKNQARKIEARNARFIRDYIPKPGEFINCICNGSFILADFIHAFVAAAGQPTESMYTTLGLNDYVLEVLAPICGQKTLLVSSWFVDKDKATTMQRAYAEGRLNGYKIGFYRNHTKVFLFHIGENYYSMSGSANLKSEGNIEQMVISNCKTTYDFWRSVFDPLIDEYNFFKLMESGRIDTVGMKVSRRLSHLKAKG